MEVVEVISENSLATLVKAEIDTQIATAKAFPRSIKTFIDKAISIATVNDNVAASCSYSLPRSGKTLDGPSVRLAEIVCSTYGNVRSGARVISNDGKTITAQGVCHDLETNNCVTVEVKRKITDKHGKTFSEDMQVVTGNAACAIAFRNAVFKVIPSALVFEVFDAAKKVAIGTAETLVERRDKAIKYFKDEGVKEDQICEVLSIKRVEDIDLEKLYTLRGMVTLIKNGESTIQDIFHKPKKDSVDKEAERMIALINDAKSVEDLMALKKNVKEPQMQLFNNKLEELNAPA
ncbi:hypothetical protein [Pedobacter africanus]|uniref:Uncharacterized protein n=1 Tax=Pedobacter africanus TaxID=151894 RepID=A0A1W1ZCN9_9SPHI|nr:hypothetical protein [Pedobacter africanus]SMC46195.1 hypothetical protein SAMN04488524_0605 [Pedobacter africanus]